MVPPQGLDETEDENKKKPIVPAKSQVERETGSIWPSDPNGIGKVQLSISMPSVDMVGISATEE